jgi:hypothetical protein
MSTKRKLQASKAFASAWVCSPSPTRGKIDTMPWCMGFTREQARRNASDYIGENWEKMRACGWICTKVRFEVIND